MSLASDSSETDEVIIVKLGMVTASVTRMHHVLIILTMFFLQGHTDQNHENKYLIILETIQAMPIKFAVQIVCLRVYMTNANDQCQSIDLDLHSRSQMCQT